MITPPPLKAGDKIGLISTARKVSREEMAPATAILKDWKLEPVFSQNLFAEHHQFAGTDEQRKSDLQNFIDNPEIKAIMCARGGYGTVRIIDQIDFSNFTKKPKWICGYSDVSVLHNKLAQLGIESLHSTMPINFAKNTPGALDSLRKALLGEKLHYEIGAHPFNRLGTCEGELTGGNLSMLYSQTGSSTALATKGKILFIEDLDEYLYHIDRMMQNLKRNGYFHDLAGMIIGSLSDMNDNKVPFGQTAEEIIRETLNNFKFPVCFGFPAGHLDDNRCLIMGRKLLLRVTDKVNIGFNG